MAQGRQLADQYNVSFFETSAKQNLNIDAAFQKLSKQIKEKLMKDQMEE